MSEKLGDAMKGHNFKAKPWSEFINHKSKGLLNEEALDLLN